MKEGLRIVDREHEQHQVFFIKSAPDFAFHLFSDLILLNVQPRITENERRCQAEKKKYADSFFQMTVELKRPENKCRKIFENDHSIFSICPMIFDNASFSLASGAMKL